MISFEDAMQLTRTVSSATAFDDAECKAMYDALQEVPFGGLVVEIGCQLGRSSSLIAQCALGKFHTVHIDPYTDQPEFLKQWHEMMWRIGDRDHSYTHMCMRTEQAIPLLVKLGAADGIDLVFIDGDHGYPSVMLDLVVLAPMVKSGGLLTMHDYGRDSLPGVWNAANDHFSLVPDKWGHIGVYGTLGVWRRK
jgi:predicted O-methyltransferase YrrM